MNLFIFNIFLCLFLQNSFMMREGLSEPSKMSSRENPSQLRLKRFKHFFKKETEIIAFGCGLLGGLSFYAVSKKLPKQKRVSLAFLGAGISGGLCFYLNKKQTGLINRSFCGLGFWLNDAKVKEYLDLRKKIGKETNENTELASFINNIKTEINKKYYDEDGQAKGSPMQDLFNKFQAKEYKEKNVRIFNQFISFDSLCLFIHEVERKELLYFLANQATIKYNLQGELIEAQYFKTCEADALAAFLAFGYYPDTCLKFLYLQPDMIMTFLENAVYYMYNEDIGERLETDNCYQKITKPFEKCCRLKITNVACKATGEKEIKKHPTEIIVKKIEEEQSLKE